MPQHGDSFFRSTLWMMMISWIIIVLLVLAFYVSVLFLNVLFRN